MRKARLSRRMLVSILALGVILAQSLPGFLPVTPALSAGTCSSSFMSNQAGWDDIGSDAGWGSSAWIVTRMPTFCSGSDPSSDFIAVWSMTTDAFQRNYAQSGFYIKRGQSSPSIFSAYSYTSCPSGYCLVFGRQTTGGENIQYFQDYDTFFGRNAIDIGWNSSSDQGILDYTRYDPTNSNNGNNYWPGPWGHEYHGETYNLANDMPGTSASPTSFTSVGYLATVNSSGLIPPAYTGITGHNKFSDKGSWCVVKQSTTSYNLYTAGSCPAGTPS